MTYFIASTMFWLKLHQHSKGLSKQTAYDMYNGQTGYQQDIDFEAFLIKDEQGSVRAFCQT